MLFRSGGEITAESKLNEGSTFRFTIPYKAGKKCPESEKATKYCPDGRDAQTQSQFEDVEVKPQALDWLFCVAAGYPFNVSCDNLEGDFEPDRVVFQRRVHAQVMDYLTNGIPERPARFIKALQNYYHTPELTAEQFPWPEALN